MDIPAAALAFIAIYFVYRWNMRWSIYFSIIFSVMAVYTKQPTIVIVPAIFIYILFKDKKLAILYGTISGLLILGIALIYNHFNPGFIFAVFEFLLIHGHSSGLVSAFSSGIKDIHQFILLHSIILVLAFVGVFHKETRRKSWLFIISAFFALIVGLRAMQFQSGAYHLMLFMAIGCVLLGFIFDIARKNDPNTDNSFSSILVSLLVLFQLITLFHAPFLPESFKRQGFPNRPSMEETRMERKPILDMINNSKGKVLSLDGTFITDAEKEINVDIDPNYWLLDKMGFWDINEFRNRLRNQEYSLIVSDAYELENYDPGNEYYEVVYRTKLHSYWVWKPVGKAN